MAKTANLNLNLFNGNDRPNYELFNQNNEIIDNILVNAKEHNHDGVNSAKINASSIVFESGDTTLSANNLEDAVKEVFQEADSKIQWITDTIGTTSSGESNPDRKVIEIGNDFGAARNTYLSNMRQATVFNVEGGLPDANASINEIARAINNTVFKDATATRDDMLSEARAITRHGMPEYGTISPQPDTSIVPSATNAVTISKGMYKNLYLRPFNIETPNPALHIRKGCNIMGINGLIDEHGSNGWDVGESIHRDKINIINEHSGIYYRQKDSSASAIYSTEYECSIKDDVGTYFNAQHFQLSKSSLICFSHDFKQQRDIYLGAIEGFTQSGSSYTVSQNYMTGKPMIKIVRSDNTILALIAYTSHICIIDINNRRLLLKNTTNGVTVKEILWGDHYKEKRNGSILFIGENGFIHCNDETSTSTGYEYITRIGHTLDLRYACVGDTQHYVKLIPAEGNGGVDVSNNRTTDMECNNDEIILTSGDSIEINKLLKNHTAFELKYTLPFGTSQTTITVTDATGQVRERIQTSSQGMATTKTIYVNDPTKVTIACTQGKVKITGVNIPEVGKEETVNKLFSTDWGFMGGFRIYGEITPTAENKSFRYFLVGGHAKDLSQGECKAIFAIARCRASNLTIGVPTFDMGKALIVDEMFAGYEPNFCETGKRHKPLSFMSEYDNYIYGTYPDLRYENSSVAATGIRYHKFKRKLIKLDFNNDYIPTPYITKEQNAFTYKLFRPTFINYRGELIGLEQSCTEQKYTYVTKLNSELESKNCFEDWSECEWRTPQEEFRIIDDCDPLNRLQFPRNTMRMFDTEGEISDIKLYGTLVSGQKETVTSTEASMDAEIENLSVSSGLFAIWNPVYKIIGTRE